MSGESRGELYVRLVEVLGPEPAAQMIDYFATKGDLASLREWAGGEFTTVRAEIAAEIAELRGEMHREFGVVRSEMAAQTRTLVVANVGSVIAVAGLVLGAVRLS